MIRIDPNTLYSKSDLQKLLGDRVSVDTFIIRLKPARRFKNLYWGQDLLDALAKCQPLDEEHPANMPPIPRRKEVNRNAQNHSDSNRLSLSEVLERKKISGERRGGIQRTRNTADSASTQPTTLKPGSSALR